MPSRTNKFYRENEAVVMKSLGLKPTVNSGSGWIEKEDGQNEHIIAQLKSTDALSMGIKLKDIRVLEYNADVSHKIPIFVIQFLQTDETFIIARPFDLPKLSELINTGKCDQDDFDVVMPDKLKPRKPKKIVKSGHRDEFWARREKEWKNKNGK